MYDFIMFSFPITSLLVIVASFLRWKKNRTNRNFAMLVGMGMTISTFIYYLLEFYFSKIEPDENGVIHVEVDLWDKIMPQLFPIGILIFGTAFLIDSIKDNKPNQSAHTTPASAPR
ncbi:hypothetical protein [Pelagicoccus sp. SDUM812003]|uniref:hypothetical protein n=1 Tax=Pelagicoccus sp. SDUM812003 TaxID=3041267 RepID=UPI00280DF048|nr:hypothetical protein [Pelagicoccus sp. SDUM812003]MDQ8203963.1 hypothetical protein [Pelagicoccus sp. SDUM812003]